jgi:hypothetical protein
VSLLLIFSWLPYHPQVKSEIIKIGHSYFLSKHFHFIAQPFQILNTTEKKDADYDDDDYSMRKKEEN